MAACSASVKDTVPGHLHKALTRMTMPQSSVVKELELELHCSPPEEDMASRETVQDPAHNSTTALPSKAQPSRQHCPKSALSKSAPPEESCCQNSTYCPQCVLPRAAWQSAQ